MAFDYPNSPTVGQLFQGLVWDGEKWVSALNPTGSGAVRYDMPQGLGANQMAQGRANISVTKKNYIINGAMMVSQENGATAGAALGYYPVDLFWMTFSNAGTLTGQQVSGYTPGGSPNRIRFTATAADAAVGAGDFVQLIQNMEGYRIADLKVGSAAAKTITIQFGVKAPAGTYCVALQNVNNNRSYVAEYTVATGEANTDVVKSVTLALDTAGSWNLDAGTGISLRWCLMGGTTYQTTANAWVAGGFFATANQFNFMGTVNNVFELFDVSLTEGSVAPPFQVPDYASELAECQRYYQFFTITIAGVYAEGGSRNYWFPVAFPAMRAVPTILVKSVPAQVNGTHAFTMSSTVNGYITINSAAAGVSYIQNGTYGLNARL